MKVVRRNEQPHGETHQLNHSMSSRETFFFYEKNTGVSHFHVEASPDGQFPVEEAAGLLAMHCMVRGQSPRDYVVMVEAAHDSLEGLTEKAEKLLQAGHSVGSSVKLTRREEEVLGGVMRSLANKEIAATLESFRAHREVPRFVAVDQVPRSRPHGVGARSDAPYACHADSADDCDP